MNISETDKETFLTGLRMGYGMTASASHINVSPKQMTDYINKHPEFHELCKTTLKETTRFLVSLANNFLAAEKVTQWSATNSRVKDYIKELVTWESYCKKEELRPEHITRACYIYKTRQECATAVGMTEREFLEYCADNVELSIFMVKKNIDPN